MKTCSVCGAKYGPDQKFCSIDGTPLSVAGPSEGLVGKIIADRYRVTSTLGEGGMGKVYLAEHVRMRRQCAVKVISPSLASTEAAVARFNREAENASQINHPNVVQVYDFGEGPDHTLYLAMEYVDGETLTSLLRREGPLSIRRAATLTKQVADALAAAHHRGIVHRDLKPDNILVTRQYDGSEWVKVVDFGIAKTVQAENTGGSGGGQTVTTVGVSIGTPEYMSPEQLAGERLDTRTDLYSLGLVFFNLLTGDLPFPRVTSRENLIHRLMQPPRTLRDVRPAQQWPPAVQAVIDRALATDLDRRYATAGDFGRDLSALIAAEPDEPEVTVKLRAAGTAPPIAATKTERAAAATATDGGVPLTVPATAALPATRRSRTGVYATAAIVIAGAALVLYQRRAAGPRIPAAPLADTVAQLPSAPVATPIESLKNTTPARPESTIQKKTVTAPGTTPSVANRAPPRPVVGDSAANKTPATNTPAPAPARIEALQRNIDGRISAGRQFLVDGDVASARGEFRQAVQEASGVVTRLPNNPDATRLRDSVARSLRTIVMQCQTAQQRRALKVTDPSFKCGSLVPARFLGGRARGGTPRD